MIGAGGWNEWQSAHSSLSWAQPALRAHEAWKTLAQPHTLSVSVGSASQSAWLHLRRCIAEGATTRDAMTTLTFEEEPRVARAGDAFC